MLSGQPKPHTIQKEEADMAKRKLSSTQICYRISLALLPIMLGLSLLYQAGIFIPTKIFPPCMFHALTGFSCPGCGSTRAVSALFRFDLLTSLKLQPANFYCALIYTAFVLSHTLALLINGIKKKHPSLFKKGCSNYYILAILEKLSICR